MKGKLKYYEKSEDAPNSVEGWMIVPVISDEPHTCYSLDEESIEKIQNHDRTQTYDVDFKLITNCFIQEDGLHVHHGVVSKII